MEMHLIEYLKAEGLDNYIELFEFLRNQMGLELPDDIKIISWDEAHKRYYIKPTALAIADPQNKIVSFMNLNEYDFIHELLHIAGGDEVEAYDITPIIYYLWKNRESLNIPKVKIKDIFKRLKKKDIEEVLKRHGFDSIAKYFEFMGVLPHIYDITPEGFKLKKEYTDDDEAFIFIVELGAGLWNPLNVKILLELLEKLSE